MQVAPQVANQLKQYSKNSGARLDLTYWLNEKWQISTALEYGEQRYNTRKHLNGNNYLWSNTLSYFPKSGQFWFVGADYNREILEIRTMLINVKISV